jgi:hypothetical protein
MVVNTKKNRVFARLLFGEFSENWIPEKNNDIPKNHQFVKSRTKVQKDIKRICMAKNKVDFVTYVYGKDNEKILNDLGFKTVLLCDEPYMWWPNEKRMWWHKLHMYRHIANQDNIKEFVFLDWDCVLNQPLFENFWDRLNQKESFQAALCRYGTPIINAGRQNLQIPLSAKRKGRAKKIVPNGGFVYFRDSTIPDKIWEFANIGCNKWLDEAAYAKYIDDLMGGWIGTKKYWDLFEPEVCRWNGKGPFKFTKKDNCFRHR